MLLQLLVIDLISLLKWFCFIEHYHTLIEQMWGQFLCWWGHFFCKSPNLTRLVAVSLASLVFCKVFERSNRICRQTWVALVASDLELFVHSGHEKVGRIRETFLVQVGLKFFNLCLKGVFLNFLIGNYTLSRIILMHGFFKWFLMGGHGCDKLDFIIPLQA